MDNNHTNPLQEEIDLMKENPKIYKISHLSNIVENPKDFTLSPLMPNTSF